MNNKSLITKPHSSDAPEIQISKKAPDASTTALSLAGLLTLASAGCGGGDSQSTNVNPSSSTASSVAPQPLTKTQAAGFLLQAQFTATDDEISSVISSGYDAWLTSQFNKTIDQTGAQWLTTSGHTTPKNDGNYFNRVFGDWMAWNQLLTGTGQVRKRLALALSEFFVV